MPAPEKVDRELQSFVRMTRAIARGESRFEHGPSTLEFAWTSACNLRCVMCGQSDNPPVVKVSKEKAAPFVDEVFKSALIWNPSATSEPLLNDVDEMVRVCEEKHVYLELYTNATLLTPERFEKLAPRIHRLTLSIDSHVPAVLEKVRYPIKAAKTFPNVAYAIRRANELSIPCVLHTVCMTETIPTYPEYVDWAADMGAKEITVLDLLDCSTHAMESEPVRMLGHDKVVELLEATRARAEARKVNLTYLLPKPYAARHIHTEVPSRIHEALVIEWLQRLHAKESAGFCPMVANYLKVEPNGDAFPCCRGPRELKLGNVFEQPLDEVWNGDVARRLRESMYSGDVPKVCQGCLVREQPMIEHRNGANAPSA
ncbi:MAG TPA: radical SAM protein [Planctomycetota bacterium]|nr:radical SAM protein [Planctomycetota bacterium]